jgi:hypothetical protein
MKFIPPHEVVGVGQVPGYVRDDDVTRAEYALEQGGPVYAYSHYRLKLMRLIEEKDWRAAEAADVLQRILRGISHLPFEPVPHVALVFPPPTTQL